MIDLWLLPLAHLIFHFAKLGRTGLTQTACAYFFRIFYKSPPQNGYLPTQAPANTTILG